MITRCVIIGLCFCLAGVPLDQVGGRVGVVIQERGDQAATVAGAAAVGAGYSQVRFDDPYGQAVEIRQVGAIGQVLEYLRVAGGLAAGSSIAPVLATSARKGVGVTGPSPAGPACRARAAGAGAGPGWPRPGRPLSRAWRRSGPRVPVSTRVITPQRGVSGEAHPVADPAQPGPVALSVRHLQRATAIEGDRAQPAEAHAGSVRGGLAARPPPHPTPIS
jgi:hypothetical protein